MQFTCIGWLRQPARVDWSLRRVAAVPNFLIDTALRLSQAARLLGVETREMARLVYERAIRHVMIDGIAHIPADAVDEYRSTHAPVR